MKRKNRIPLNPRGAALIVALFIMALIAASAIALVTLFRIDLRRSQLILNATQSYFYAQGSIAWAIDTLSNDLKNKKPNQIVDRTPITPLTGHEESFTIDSTLEDAQGLFNINNLTNDQYIPLFIQLLKAVQPTLSPESAQQLAKAIKDWVTQGLKNTSYDQYYLKQTPPSVSAHRPMASISELLLVKGMTSALYTLLEPYLTALPPDTPININNAPLPVLMSLSQAMTLDEAKKIALLVKTTPYTDVSAFTQLPVMQGITLPQNALTVTSNYFLLTTNVTVDQQKTVLYTLLNRTMGSNNQPTVVIVWQSKGTL